MAEKIEDLTIEYVEDGVTTIKELDKVILTKGAWCTILYKFQNWNRSKQEYSPVSYSIRRYQKRNGVYQQRSKFNISSNDQAQKIIEALNHWMAEDKTEQQ
ncbi:MAG: hypothetical protein A3F10_00500 [Coxiella sp. RIFCSPHIGHO2_12_FULL_42_15]|nr:MAG: hypothetical protein A3F10_00500 [Coxiella sp. RIFCSPHIGHO2_12_FULL_42_15]